MPPKRGANVLDGVGAPKKAKSSNAAAGAAALAGESIPGGPHTGGGVLLSAVIDQSPGNVAFKYPDWVLPERARVLTDCTAPRTEGANCVVYWMSRDQRAEDNWAMLMARESAKSLQLPLVVCFNLVPHFLGATLRQFGFMLRGLSETEASLRAKHVPFYLLRGAAPGASVAAFAGCAPDASSSSSSSSSAASSPAATKLAAWEPAALAEVAERLVEVSNAGDAAGLASCIDALATGGRMTVAQLRGSSLGKDMRSLKKHADPTVAAKAGQLVDLWKAAVALETAPETAPEPPPSLKAALVFTDMAPLRLPMQWVRDAAALLGRSGVPLVQVDAHNIVPVWLASDKQEVGARTLRPKIHAQLPRFLANMPPPLEPNTVPGAEPDAEPSAAAALPEPTDWVSALASLGGIDRSVGEVGWAAPGAVAGAAVLAAFCEHRIKAYDEKRNDPNELGAASNLSPWLHFGQLAPQRAAIAAKAAARAGGSASAGGQSFIEEAVVRRELSDNFCFHNAHYDSLEGAAAWARESLALHAADERPFARGAADLEAAQTYDDLWNACQLQLVREGKMHGFLRMYWAKKLLEWSPTPAEALRVAIHLNDKYSLDGRDPNGTPPPFKSPATLCDSFCRVPPYRLRRLHVEHLRRA